MTAVVDGCCKSAANSTRTQDCDRGKLGLGRLGHHHDWWRQPKLKGPGWNLGKMVP